MVDKYSINFSKDSVVKNFQRLTNQLWKLIPMKENEENWSKQLDTVVIEIIGLQEIFEELPLLQLLSKLEGLRIEEDISFELYRKTVFEAINLLQELKRNAKV